MINRWLAAALAVGVLGTGMIGVSVSWFARRRKAKGDSHAGEAGPPSVKHDGSDESQQWRRQTARQMRSLVASQEAEYRRLSEHLHDDVCQLLAALCMHLHLAEASGGPDAGAYVQQCLAIAQQASEHVRDMSLDLSPSMLGDVRFPDVLRSYLDRQAQRTGLAVKVIASTAWTPLRPELDAACFRVTQEALRNVIRHAAARQVQVELRQDAEAVSLTIRDDGVGFDPSAIEPPASRAPPWGLTAVRQRVELLGGNCRIESAPGQGTTIRVCLPLADRLAEDITVGRAMLEGQYESDVAPDRRGAARSHVSQPGRER